MAKVTINTANGRKRNKHYIPSVNLTTSDVGQLQPTCVVECMAGDHIDIDFSAQSQTQPTAVKTFGSFSQKNFAFFVPFKSVWRHYEDWMVSSADTSIECDESPQIGLWTILQTIFGLRWDGDQSVYTLINTPYAETNFHVPGNLAYSAMDSAQMYLHTSDFIIHVKNTSSDYGYLGTKLKASGRLLLKVLQGLGYQIPKRLDLVGFNETDNIHPFQSEMFNAIPLLSFGRIFYDYIYPSAYVQQQGFGYFFEQDQWDFGANDSLLADFFDMFFVPYDQDFFTSLWIKPNAKALGSNSYSTADIPLTSTTNFGSLYGISDQDASVLHQNTSSTKISLSANALRWLEDMSDYVIRNQIGGTRFHEWMKTHFGWVTSEQDSNRCKFLKSFSSTIGFSPVTSSTNGSELYPLLLGQMASNGFSESKGRLKFECKEHGLIIFLNMVVPASAYYQGVAPHCLPLKSKFDLYVPELDGADLQPVARKEVFMSYDKFGDLTIAPPAYINNAFGFAPRYADRLKRGSSVLNGDFRLPTRNADLDAYHTFRDVTYNRSNLALDAQFMHADNQTNRVYAVPVTSDGESQRDHIETLFTFAINRYSTASSIGDSYPIFNKSGQSVTVENGGTSLS